MSGDVWRRRSTRPEQQSTPRAATDKRDQEQRLYGLNACLAVERLRRPDIRKLWFSAERREVLSRLLSWCAKERVGYREVDSEELERISGSRHHEGVCAQVLHRPEPTLEAVLERVGAGPAQLLAVAGVGNPHNLGAMLRCAANFGAGALLHQRNDGLSLSAAACRVAEGGAEVVPMIAFDDWPTLRTRLREKGFVVAATTPHQAQSLFAGKLPQRLVWLLGAEGNGLNHDQLAHADLRIGIPGSGGVESLNVAAATAVLLAEHWRQHHG